MHLYFIILPFLSLFSKNITPSNRSWIPDATATTRQEHIRKKAGFLRIEIPKEDAGWQMYIENNFHKKQSIQHADDLDWSLVKIILFTLVIVTGCNLYQLCFYQPKELKR